MCRLRSTMHEGAAVHIEFVMVYLVDFWHIPTKTSAIIWIENIALLCPYNVQRRHNTLRYHENKLQFSISKCFFFSAVFSCDFIGNMLLHRCYSSTQYVCTRLALISVSCCFELLHIEPAQSVNSFYSIFHFTTFLTVIFNRESFSHELKCVKLCGLCNVHTYHSSAFRNFQQRIRKNHKYIHPSTRGGEKTIFWLSEMSTKCGRSVCYIVVVLMY